MIRFASLAVLLSTIACQGNQETSILKADENFEHVDNMVLPSQDEWLTSLSSEDRNGGFEKLVVFGDSMSDTGRFKASLAPGLPEQYFWEGRWTNGPVWPEYASKVMGVELENYAFGAAETRNKALILRLSD